MPLLLNNREVAAAMNAGEYVETMEQAFRELGAGRAVNSLRVDACVPLAGYTPELQHATHARIDALPLDADPVYAPATMAAAKQAGDTVYRLKTITGGYPACGMMAVRISTHFDTQTELAGMLLEDDVATFDLSRAVVVSIKPFGDNSDFVQNYVAGEKRGPTFGQLINRKARKFDWASMIELGNLLNGRAAGRESPDEITHHINNNGCGMQFAAAGARILDNACRMGLGVELSGDYFLQKEHT